MRAATSRSRSFWTAVLAALVAAALLACDEDGLLEPNQYPDVSGFWSGQYRVGGCILSGSTDPFFCDETFYNGASLILELDLGQAGSRVSGVAAQGELVGDVDGAVRLDGVLKLEGVIGDLEDDFTTKIQAWQTGLVGDSLLGSWRFQVEDNTGSGFGVAIVDASLRLYGASVLKFFGCAAEGDLGPGGAIAGELADPDCQLEDGSFFDVYSLSGSPGDSIEVTLRSSGFDAYLFVSDLEEGVLGEDDNSGGGPDGTDALVTVVFETAGTVLVLANAFAPGAAGPYTLSAVQLRPSAGPTPSRALPSIVRVIGSGPGKRGRAGGDAAAPGMRFSRRPGPGS